MADGAAGPLFLGATQGESERTEHGGDSERAPASEPTCCIRVLTALYNALPAAEAINGRSAMLGFVAAMVSEGLTHHSVLSQMFGVTVNGEVVEVGAMR